MSIAVWQGFDHRWKRESHRLNLFGSYIERVNSDSPSKINYISLMQIGRFPPDQCRAYGNLHLSGNMDTNIIDGEHEVVVKGKVGVQKTIKSKIITHKIPKGTTATVISRGFELKSLNFKRGFHTRGFGFNINDVKVKKSKNNSGISFRASFTIFPDRSPDPLTDPDRLIWKILRFPYIGPKTPEVYEYQMKLYYSVIFNKKKDVFFYPFNITRDKLWSALDEAGDEIVKGEAGYKSATLGIQGFKWNLGDWGWTRFNGRYLRRLKFYIGNPTYDPKKGEYSFSPQMNFTNLGGRMGGRDLPTLAQRIFKILIGGKQSYREKSISLFRSLRGSYRFRASYELNSVLMQFKDGTNFKRKRFLNLVKKGNTYSQIINLRGKQKLQRRSRIPLLNRF